jgi:hypothetical protein
MKLAAIAIAASLLTGAAGITTGVIGMTSADHAQSQVKTDERQITTLQNNLSATDSRLNSIDEQVSGLTTPTDPLGNYDQVCWNNNVTTTSGQTETVYYPCTNNAQTIPQPGN